MTAAKANTRPVSRRQFMAASSLTAAMATRAVSAPATEGLDKPVLLGGKPVRSKPFPDWPVENATDEQAVAAVVRSGKWGRGVGKKVVEFEQLFATLMNARYCLATSSGTTALFTALNVLGVGPGDEVIVAPYTFVACVNVILACHALPVFADTDPETFQIDPRKLEQRISRNTAAIMPVHLGGGAFNVDAIQAIAAKHGIPIVEDSCQSHLAEWKGRRTGSFGAAGCFSFQASKNLNAGEGGAILSSASDFIDKCYAFHNNGRTRTQPGYDFSYATRGLNLRMTEFQGALLATQMTRLDEQSRRRADNAGYLTSMLHDIGGLTAVRMSEGCTRNAYHLFMMRYAPDQFAGLPREKFLKALSAEGIPGSGGYYPLNKEKFLEHAFGSKAFSAIYSKERLARWREANQCPGNDQVCAEAVWFTQNMLIGSRDDMDQIAAAVRKIKKHAPEIAKA